LLDQRLAIAANRRVVFRRPFEGERDRPALRFGVRRHVNERVLVCRHAGIDARQLLFLRGNLAERVSHQLLGLVHRNVADHDHCHVVGPIPLFVERHQPFARRAFQDFGQTNRQPLRIARPLENHRQLFVGEA
jgi:hypothetical protein